MTKLFVVTHGCYSDYGIEAVFDDRALAERYCEGSDDSDGYGSRIEEFELNPKAEEIRAGLKAHDVTLDRAGNVLSHSESYGGDPTDGEVFCSFRWSPDNHRHWKTYHFAITIIAKTKEQAIKAANEYRARFIAEGNPWPEDEV